MTTKPKHVATKAKRSARMSNPSGSSQFGERLRRVRVQKNLKQEELAAMVGVSVVQYGRYERGTSVPSSQMLKRIADALGLSGDYLLSGDTPRAARANFEDLELLQLFQEVQAFPHDEKVMVKKILEAFVVKRKVQALAAG